MLVVKSAAYTRLSRRINLSNATWSLFPFALRRQFYFGKIIKLIYLQLRLRQIQPYSSTSILRSILYENGIFIPKYEKSGRTFTYMCTNPCLRTIISQIMKCLTQFFFYPFDDSTSCQLTAIHIFELILLCHRMCILVDTIILVHWINIKVINLTHLQSLKYIQIYLILNPSNNSQFVYLPTLWLDVPI